MINWWIFDRGDILSLMANDSTIAIFMTRQDAKIYSTQFNIKILKKENIITVKNIKI